MAKLPKQWMVICLALLSILIGCGTEQKVVPTASPQSNRVLTTSFALQSMTQRLVAGTGIAVECPAAEAANPREWSPSVDDIVRVQSADLIVGNGLGAPYAKWLARVTIDSSKLCNSIAGFSTGDLLKVTDYQVVHSHGPEGEHSHPYFVAYPWIDPSLAIKQAEKICESLSATYQEFASNFSSNLEELKSELEEVIESKSKVTSSSNVICLNPSMKFLTRWMGLNDKHLLFFTADDMKEMSTLRQQIQQALSDTEKNVLLVNYELPDSASGIVAELGVETVVIDVMDRNHGSDFVSVIESNIEKLESALAN